MKNKLSILILIAVFAMSAFCQGGNGDGFTYSIPASQADFTVYVALDDWYAPLADQTVGLECSNPAVICGTFVSRSGGEVRFNYDVAGAGNAFVTVVVRDASNQIIGSNTANFRVNSSGGVPMFSDFEYSPFVFGFPVAPDNE